LLLAFIPLVIAMALFLLDEEASAGTTYIDGDWHLNGVVALRNGTWVINGSMYFKDGLLIVEDAELVFKGEGKPRVLVIGERVEDIVYFTARNSTIRAADCPFEIVSVGEILLDNCTLGPANKNVLNHIISHGSGNLTVDNCTFPGNMTGGIYSRGSLMVRHCFFNGPYRPIHWVFPEPWTGEPPQGLSLAVEHTVFNRSGVYWNAIRAVGPKFKGSADLSVSGCTFRNGLGAIDIEGFYINGSVLIENNTVTGCSSGIIFDGIGTSAILQNNLWNVTENGIVIGLSNYCATCPSIRNEVIRGGWCGLKITGGSKTYTMEAWDLNITSCKESVRTAGCTLNLWRSYVRAEIGELFAESGAIYLRECDHTMQAGVSTYGMIEELQLLNVTGVSWQDGTPITEGRLLFYHQGKYLSCESNCSDPEPFWITRWRLTWVEMLFVNQTTAMYMQRSVLFDSVPIDLEGVREIEIIIWDDFVPLLRVLEPIGGSIFNHTEITVRGCFTEYGIGLKDIRIRQDEGPWSVAAHVEGGSWWISTNVSNGVHTIDVLIKDMGGNTRQVQIRNLTVDTIPPTIEVIQPSPWVRISPQFLIVQTEEDALAWINRKSVSVDENGRIEVSVELSEGSNSFHISVMEISGNVNSTTFYIFLDFIPPMLRIDEPREGSWTNAEMVQVSGLTEEFAVVEVDGHLAAMDGGNFSYFLPLPEGTHTITVTSRDRAGNVNIEERKVHVDRTSPYLIIQDPMVAEVKTNRTPITFSGHVVEIGPFTVTVEEVQATVTRDAWSVSVELQEGWNEIEVVAEDAAGNMARSIRLVHLDMVPPDYEVYLELERTIFELNGDVILTGASIGYIVITCYENCSIYLNTSQDFQGVLTTEEGETHNIKGDLSFLAPWGYHTIRFQVLPGINSIGLLVGDLNGNHDVMRRITIDMDDVPPNLTIIEPMNNLRTSNKRVAIIGETEPGASVEVNGHDAYVSEEGTFMLDFELQGGSNQILVVARDPFGNEANETRWVYRHTSESDSLPWSSPIGWSILGLAAAVLALFAVSLMRARSNDASQSAYPRKDNDEGEPHSDEPSVRARRRG
jgi:hypothetical protein